MSGMKFTNIEEWFGWFVGWEDDYEEIVMIECPKCEHLSVRDVSPEDKSEVENHVCPGCGRTTKTIEKESGMDGDHERLKAIEKRCKGFISNPLPDMDAPAFSTNDMALVLEQVARQDSIRIVFVGEGPDCQLVEVENADGEPIRIGTWRRRGDGFQELIIEMPAPIMLNKLGKTAGRVAYEAQTAERKRIEEDERDDLVYVNAPSWDDLLPEHRRSWEHAARVLVEAIE